MLLVQHNCGHEYENTMIALKIALSVEAGIIIIQKPFISNQKIFCSGFNFYWPQGERKNMRVMTAVRNNLADKIVVDHRMDLIKHHYFMLIEIQELDL